MSNRVTLEPTKFEDTRSNTITYGYRAYDNHAATYNNCWESIPNDDLEFLQKVLEDDDPNTIAMLNFVQEMEKGLYIGDTYYEWEQVKHLWNNK